MFFIIYFYFFHLKYENEIEWKCDSMLISKIEYFVNNWNNSTIKGERYRRIIDFLIKKKVFSFELNDSSFISLARKKEISFDFLRYLVMNLY